MTPEQHALIEKARESLRAARLLQDEGMADFSISRAYYAMFYVAEALLLQQGLTFSKHSAVIAAFGQYLTKTGQVAEEFHRYLIEGQESRTVGDYDTGSELSEEDALEQIQRADKFLELADQMFGAPTKS